ncbi:Sirohydrochlorin ferrochelatase, chloroplastic [Porphyridium purpureum]|uniref:Sirohydrochlorin ferrochelatase, chloroplastic n=1 Tax=Porphyridium purpureum TaxID=35688 RepID=A0A5J4Z698_PORPP|nr:Sirohydrochlorin ferrochelatase, chloroplastic [Porphyridium purpureum]|eukprot:POR8139..scf295_1
MCQSTPAEGIGSSVKEDDSESPARRRLAILLVDHGSKRDEANSMLDEMAKMVISRLELTTNVGSDTPSDHEVVGVFPAHMEIAPPSIQDSMREAVLNHRAEHVVVLPFFLSRGRHIQQDIPALVADAVNCLQSEHGAQFTHEIRPHLGVSDRLADLLLVRAGLPVPTVHPDGIERS